VIIDLPVREIDRVFDYSIPEVLKDRISIGSVVVVPFGRLKRIGFVVGLSESSEVERVLPVEAIVNEQAVFNSNMVELAKWISEYYLSTFVEALKLAIPPGYTSKIVQNIKLIDVDSGSIFTNQKINAEQKVYGQLHDIMDFIRSRGGTATLDEVKAAIPLKYLSSQLKKLETLGLIERAYELERSKIKELIANYAVLSESITGLSDFEKVLEDLRKAPKQRSLIEVLFENGAQRVSELLGSSAAPYSSLQSLVEKGFVKIEERQLDRVIEDHFTQKDISVNLTTEQQSALDEILKSMQDKTPDSFLLQGVTGSGKTEVYLRAIQRAIENGQTAIVLVPEIVLTAQAVARFKARFGEAVAVLHSKLGAGERFDQWRGIRDGRYKVVVGARSAIFAPVGNLGIVIVDEEHESSYKQGRSPRYHAREVAIKRAELEGACIVLGSATPSLEVKWRSETGLCRPLFLRNRVQKRELPQIEIVDMRDERYRAEDRIVDNKDDSDLMEIQDVNQDEDRLEAQAEDQIKIDTENLLGTQPEKISADQCGGNNASNISGDNNRPKTEAATALNDQLDKRKLIGSLLKSRIDETIKAGEKVILFLNRRGFSNFIICEDCGFVPKCDNCAVSMTFHSVNNSLRCHHCNSAMRAPASCPKCGGLNIGFPGSGTQRVEKELSDLYPEVPVIRMDADTTARKGAHQKWLKKFQSEKTAILLGTQMIAKGLDFPEVTLVGVINADTSLNLPDFHAAEHTFQLMMQVAGRAGRGEQPGRVVIQTRNPESDPLQAVLAGDYDEFFKTEIESRNELGYPPFSSIIRLVFSGKDPVAVVTIAKRAAKIAESAGFTSSMLGGQIATIVGPSPAPLLKVRGEYRWHMLLKVQDALTTKGFLKDNYRRFVPEKYQNVVILTIDVDPVWVL
jgi:primosomal protein N' (replication factor Y)